MSALDRLDWAAGLAFRAFGSRIGVRVDDARLLEKIADRLPPQCRPSRSLLVNQLFSVIGGGPLEGTRGRRYGLLYSGNVLQLKTLDQGELVDAFESLVNSELAANAARWLFLHSAVVGWRGRAILLPGDSESGKSRLAEALVRAGATYYSDDLAPIDSRGRVHPFTKPLSRRMESGGAERLSAASLGSAPAAGALPIGLVVFTRFQPGARWSPRVLTPGEAVLSLVPHTSRMRTAPALALRRLAKVAEQVPAITTLRDEADAAAADILALEIAS